MHSVGLEPTKLILIGTRITYQATGVLDVDYFGLGMLTLLRLRSRFGGKPLTFQVGCPQNGTAVLTGLSFLPQDSFRFALPEYLSYLLPLCVCIGTRWDLNPRN